MRCVTIGDSGAVYIPSLLCVYSGFIAMTALPFYGRSRKYAMRELESSTRISLSRLTLAKLSAVGVGDIVCLGVIILFIFGKVEAPARAMLLFVVLPFLLTCTGSLFILNRAKQSYSTSVTVGFGIGLSVLYWALAVKMPEALTQLSAGFGLLACALLILALLLECRKLLRQIPFSDLQV
jgi:hypothetical protein